MVALVGGEAPDLVLPDVDGEVHSFADQGGKKRVLVTWASWCGCRHEIAAWEALHQELHDDGLEIFSVAIDNSADDARPWVEAAQPSFPTVVDSAHVTAERYGITNVPSTVWVDEDGHIVKPPTISPGDDQFRDFTNIDSSAHHDALRRWVHDGVLPDARRAARAARPHRGRAAGPGRVPGGRVAPRPRPTRRGRRSHLASGPSSSRRGTGRCAGPASRSGERTPSSATSSSRSGRSGTPPAAPVTAL